MRNRGYTVGGVLLGAAVACVPLRASAANRDALREIVQDQCLPHWLAQHQPQPCESVYLPSAGSPDGGYAVLADRKGGAHFLLIPTKTIPGVESTELAATAAPNYFADAWMARDRLAAVLGHPVRREVVGLAVNPKTARSQDQLHIHIECLRSDIARSLLAAANGLNSAWQPLDMVGRRFLALRVMGAELGDANPFALLAAGVPQARVAAETFSIVVTGMQFKEGPGFIVLASTTVPGELLLDSTCAAA